MKKTYSSRAEKSTSDPRNAPFTSRLLIFIVAALLLSACASVASTPTPIPTISLDGNSKSSMNGTPSSDADSISASAVIVPVKDAQLSFSAVGRVTEVNVKVGDKVTSGQPLVNLDKTIQEARIREAEANLLAAQVQYNYQKRLGLDEVHIESAEADVARMQALLDSAKVILDTQYVLIAPFNGTIVATDVAPAETVVPGQVVITLGDLSKYQIETTDLSERDVTRVHVGQPANVFIEALGEEFPARVIDVDRVSTTLGGDVVFKVTLELENQPEGLLWGMSADVQIETAE
jgi:RND family efflux transporter MFP subunit